MEILFMTLYYTVKKNTEYFVHWIVHQRKVCYSTRDKAIFIEGVPLGFAWLLVGLHWSWQADKTMEGGSLSWIDTREVTFVGDLLGCVFRGGMVTVYSTRNHVWVCMCLLHASVCVCVCVCFVIEERLIVSIVYHNAHTHSSTLPAFNTPCPLCHPNIQ